MSDANNEQITKVPDANLHQRLRTKESCCWQKAGGNK